MAIMIYLLKEDVALEDDKLIEVLKIAFPFVAESIKYLATAKPYGIIKESAFVNIDGRKGRLVWDYIVYNELTFECEETGEKYSLFTSVKDDEIKKRFEEMKSKYGI